MRNLFAGILLAAALPASASISSELAAGDASASDIINNAMAACGGSGSCQALAIEDAVAAGVDITTVINLAIAAGADAKAAVAAASAAALKAGKSVDTVLAAALAADGVPAETALGGVTAGATASGTSTADAQAAVAKAATSLNVDPQVIVAGVTGTPTAPTAGGNNSGNNAGNNTGNNSGNDSRQAPPLLTPNPNISPSER